jgi:UDP-2-acetamido-3-amino-2,3-dideoxy-glucuronate N-acetyltransferase
MTTTIYPTANVGEGAQLGEYTRGWRREHIRAGARVGQCCSFGQNVVVGNEVVVDDSVRVQNNVYMYDTVTLEDDLFCGPSVVFANVCNPAGADPQRNEYGQTLVKQGATLGANSTIVCSFFIDEHSFIGADAFVNRDVVPYDLMVGVPVVQFGWMSECRGRTPLPLRGDGDCTCVLIDLRCRLNDRTLSKIAP